jgi:hypothetical protein
MRRFFVFAAGTIALLPLQGCVSQQARTERVERRQAGIDERAAGRQERWKIRADRQDARARAQFDSW